MTLIVDRLEGSQAVMELPGGAWWYAQRTLLPRDIEEGDALTLCADRFERDPVKTHSLREQARSQLQRLSST